MTTRNTDLFISSNLRQHYADSYQSDTDYYASVFISRLHMHRTVIRGLSLLLPDTKVGASLRDLVTSGSDILPKYVFAEAARLIGVHSDMPETVSISSAAYSFLHAYINAGKEAGSCVYTQYQAALRIPLGALGAFASLVSLTPSYRLTSMPRCIRDLNLDAPLPELKDPQHTSDPKVRAIYSQLVWTGVPFSVIYDKVTDDWDYTAKGWGHKYVHDFAEGIVSGEYKMPETRFSESFKKHKESVVQTSVSMFKLWDKLYGELQVDVKDLNRALVAHGLSEVPHSGLPSVFGKTFMLSKHDLLFQALHEAYVSTIFKTTDFSLDDMGVELWEMYSGLGLNSSNLFRLADKYGLEPTDSSEDIMAQFLDEYPALDVLGIMDSYLGLPNRRKAYFQEALVKASHDPNYLVNVSSCLLGSGITEQQVLAMAKNLNIDCSGLYLEQILTTALTTPNMSISKFIEEARKLRADRDYRFESLEVRHDTSIAYDLIVANFDLRPFLNWLLSGKSPKDFCYPGLYSGNGSMEIDLSDIMPSGVTDDVCLGSLLDELHGNFVDLKALVDDLLKYKDLSSKELAESGSKYAELLASLKEAHIPDSDFIDHITDPELHLALDKDRAYMLDDWSAQEALGLVEKLGGDPAAMVSETIAHFKEVDQILGVDQEDTLIDLDTASEDELREYAVNELGLNKRKANKMDEDDLRDFIEENMDEDYGEVFDEDDEDEDEELVVPHFVDHGTVDFAAFLSVCSDLPEESIEGMSLPQMKLEALEVSDGEDLRVWADQVGFDHDTMTETPEIKIYHMLREHVLKDGPQQRLMTRAQAAKKLSASVMYASPDMLEQVNEILQKPLGDLVIAMPHEIQEGYEYKTKK